MSSTLNVSSASESNSIDSHPLALGDSSPGRPSSRNEIAEQAPPTYSAKRDTLRGQSSTSHIRPSYFDLQRLAAAAQIEAVALERDLSATQAVTQSTISSSTSTSSHGAEDEVEEIDDGEEEEDEEIPRWLNQSNGMTPSRRPASRNSIYSTMHQHSSRRDSIFNQRENGTASRNSTRSPPPPTSGFHKVTRQLRNNASVSHSIGTAEAGVFEDEEESVKTSQQLLTSLYLMNDDDLDRQLGFAGPGSTTRPNLSPLQSTSSSGGSENTASRSMTSNLLAVPAPATHATRSSSSLEHLKDNAAETSEAASKRSRHRLVRDLSERLGSTLRELNQSTKRFEQEREKLMLTLSAKRKEAEAREEALVDILSSMGVSSARVERALMQATSQSHVPVFKADERVADYTSNRLNQSHPARQQSGHTYDGLLPESLREAMSEGIDGPSPRTNRMSVFEGLKRPIPRHSTSGTLLEGDLTPHRAGSPLLTSSKLINGAAQGQTSDVAQPTARAAWGSGLVPWMGGSGGSKKARPSIQATSPAAVEADGYFSDGPGKSGSRLASSPSPQGKTVSRSSSISAVMAQADDESEGDEEERNQAAPKGAFGLLGSLTWRRKKPVKTNKVSKGLDTHSVQGQDQIDTLAGRKSRRSSAAEHDSASFRSSRTGKSSTSGSKPTEEEDGNDGANEATVRAKPGLVRPQAQFTLSGRDVISALYEAIGSPPVSPETEKKQPFLATADLPKPPHYKAICLATRIMTSDAASILLDSGKETSQKIREMSMTLVSGARDEGKSVVEGNGLKTRRRSLKSKPLMKRTKSNGEDRDARANNPASATSANGSSTSTATLSRTLGKYSKPAQKMTEPNVTRLPHLFGFGSIPAKEVAPKGSHGKSIDARPQADEMPLVTELEPILAHDVKPPTLAMSVKRLPFVAQQLKSRKRRNTLDSMDKVLEGDESSGDEFEVYGGKNLQSTVSSSQASRRIDGTDDALLTDRYGFVYDATPADVRLLRRARKEATHAPACLTGIRVGVRARGGTDSQSDDDKDDVDLVGPDSDDEDAQELPVKGNDSDSASQHTVSSRKTAGTGGGASAIIGNTSNGMSLLAVTPSKPVAEASTLSAASQNSSQPGPTCPIQERLHFEGQEASAAATKTAVKRPPSTSQTVKRLLGQLQKMHQSQQAIQQTEWDAFLRRRRAGAKEKVEASPSDNRSLAGVVRKGSDVLGIKSKTAGATFPKMDSTGLSEEEWHLGGLVGLSQMGTETKDYQDFIQMIQRGVPLIYRSKIWYECSGAMELNEPGRYQELLLEHENEENLCTNQIDLDIGRTMPTNIYFAGDGPGVPKLRRLLVAFSWYNPKCGYCQGMNNLAATLLLTHATEEEAFWVLVSIIEKILPEEYYTSHLLVSQADQRVLMDLMDDILPRLSSHIRELGVDLPAVTFAWFLSLYTDCLPVETLFRVWDLMFVEGMVVLFRIAVAIFIINEKELLETSSPSAFYSFVHSMTSHLFSVDRLIKLACEDLKTTVRKEFIIERREKHARDLTSELGLDIPTLSAA